MIVLWRPNDGARRAGFAVARQIRGAVQRNRVRRRLREAYRAARDAAPTGVDLVVIGRSAALTLVLGTLIDDMRAAFRAIPTAERAGEARAPASSTALECPGARESE